MGRRLNVSTPTVINTELIPLSESFYVEADGQLEQWYYENDERYAPNRKVTPMTLTPHISAFDKDTNMTYTPSFYIVRWFKLDWDDTQSDYVETEITNQVDSTAADYVKVGNDLLVKKNVGYTHSVTIICRAQYIDPRDSGITYNVEDSVLLTTNRDATILSPELDVDCPSSQAFNPLVDNHLDNNDNLVYDSEFTMKATSDYSSVLATNVAQYKVDPLGTEEVIPTNETAIVTSAPTMDIRYGDYEQTNQQFMRRQTSGGQIPYIAGNMAYVNKIKGNTVKWNQLGKHLEGTDSSTGGWYPNDITPVKNGHVYFAGYTTNDIVDALFAIINGNYVSLIDAQARSAFVIYTPQQDIDTFQLAVWRTDHYVIDYTFIDLTLMFGAGNEPSTVAEFESWLATNVGLQSYYPYNEGELIPVKMSAIKSVGFNIWDEQWENGEINQTTGENTPNASQIRAKNFISVDPTKTYYIKSKTGSYYRMFYYDRDGCYIGCSSAPAVNNEFSFPSGCYKVRFILSSQYGTTYLNDTCINLSDASRNGTYEAHWEAEQYLPITELKGKVNGTGDSVVIFPNGMNHVGDVYDEIKVDGGVIKAIKRCGMVNLDNLTWAYSEQGNYFTDNQVIADVKVYGANDVQNIIATNYRRCKYYQASSYATSYYGALAFASSKQILVPSASNTPTPTGWLYYELATPVEYIIDNMPRGQFEWYGISNNAEVLVENLPWYKSGQHTDTLVVDAMYGEEIRVVLRSRFSAGSDRLYPSRVYRSIVWKIPDVDINAYSENGGAVRGNTVSMNFDTIVNVKGSTLSDAIKNDNLRFNWKLRKSNSSTETDFGWGLRRTIAAEDLRNTIGASSSLARTLVLPYGYLLGANEVVTDSSEVVTDNGEPVYDRPVF